MQCFSLNAHSRINAPLAQGSLDQPSRILAGFANLPRFNAQFPSIIVPGQGEVTARRRRAEGRVLVS